MRKEMDLNLFIGAAMGIAGVLLFQALERRFLRKAADMIRDAREIEALRKVRLGGASRYEEPERPHYDGGE